MAKIRLDQLVFDRGLTPSRERAKTSVMAGMVRVDGKRIDKPGTAVSADAVLELAGDALPYVSRGGLKLEKALSSFGLDPLNLICVDCGASTGGFTDVLLQAGAQKVYAVDVGYGQLAWSLRSDPRVVVMERTNIRYVTPEQLEPAPQLAVMDLSFISLRLVLPVVRELLTADGQVVCLIKPQFEAGREKVGKKGVVRDKATHIEVITDFLEYSAKAGFCALGLDFSPIKGPEGNIEYLAHLQKGGNTTFDTNIAALVDRAHTLSDIEKEASSNEGQ